MRILHVLPSLAARTGGPAVTAVEMARVAALAGATTAVYATDLGAPAQASTRSSVRDSELVPGASEVEVRLFPAQPPRRYAYSPTLRRALRADVSAYDVVHIHSLFLYPQFAAAREAAAHRVPYIVCPHSALDPWLRPRGRLRKALVDRAWQKRMLECAAVLHFTAEEELRLAADVAPRRPHVVVPNGVRWRDFGDLPPASAFRTRFLGGRSNPIVLFFGRIAEKKGIDILVRAFAHLPADSDAILVFVGPDDEGRRRNLEALADSLGIGDRVVFTGMLVGRDKLAALGAADVWALPSHTEGFSIALIEALAAGLPCVISPSVNIAPELADAEAAVVASLIPEVVGAALANLLAQPALRAELGRRARVFARQYDWEALSEVILGMYEGALAPRGRQ